MYRVYDLTISSTPTVALTAAVPTAVVGGKQRGEFRLTLSSASQRDLTINYKLSGSAANGKDYARLTGSTKIKAGNKLGHVYITPRGNLGGAASKLVDLALAPGSGYKVGTTGKLKVKILPAP